MKFNIFGKLYLATLAATASVILFMVIFMNWSFREGFVRYQQQSERASVERLADYLAAQYLAQGDWSYLTNNPRSWQRALLQVSEQAAIPVTGNTQLSTNFSDGSRPLNSTGAPNLPMLSLRALSARISLRDDQGQLILGRDTSAAEQPQRIEITINQQRVGWLELAPQQLVTNALASSFLQQQGRNVYLIALFAALLSLVVTLVVVRQLLGPVKKLTEGAKLLANGQFSTHIRVTADDELGELARRFNQLADFLKRNEELRTQWIADVSHELRTPLAVLRSEIEAMLDGVRQPSLTRIRSLHAETLSLGKLVDDLYYLSLSDAGDIELPDEHVDLGALLNDVLDAFAARMAEKQLNIANHLDEAIYPVRGDDKRLYQLFSNVLENSYRYTDDGGVVDVNLTMIKQQVVVTVADSSPGVPDAALPRLFDRLFRVDKSRSRVMGGSGLGLSICRNIVNMHNGSICADHADSGGLLLRISLPLAVPDTLKKER